MSKFPFLGDVHKSSSTLKQLGMGNFYQNVLKYLFWSK